MNVRGSAILFGAFVVALGFAAPARAREAASPLKAAENPSQPVEGSKPVEGSNVAREVGHELRGLLHYTVFDIISYQVQGNNVTLQGAVTQPYVKSEAESALKGIEGIGTITNNIKVLPASPQDDGIRRAEFHTIYGEGSPLFHYAVAATASIHIVVDGGHVSLEGAVDSQGDKNLAGIRAMSVPGVFSVMNNLQVISNDRR